MLSGMFHLDEHSRMMADRPLWNLPMNSQTVSSTSTPTAAGPIYRRATSADVPTMARIRLAVTENRLRDPSRVTLAMYEDFLEQDGRGWVALIDGATVAFSYANRTDGSIWALFVDPPHEGKGLARPLLALATDWLFSIGFEEVRLDTGAGTRADRFYARQGWRRAAAEGSDVTFTLARSAPP